MKVLYIITGLGLGGAEHVVVNLADQMIERGHKVKIAYLTGDVLVRPKSPDVELIYLGLNSGKDFWNAFRKYQKLVRDYCPDVVHAHMVHSNLFARINRLFCKIPRLICTAHNSNEGGKLRMFAYRCTNWLSDLNTNVSIAATQSLIDKGAFTLDNLIPIYNGIDFKRFNTDGREENTLFIDEKIQFLSVGSFSAQKDYPNLLRAISKVIPLYNNIHFNIAGDGELRYEIEQLIIKLNLSQYVTLLGRRNDVLELMEKADFFILSSAWEGLPIVLLEASMSKLFIIATDCGGVKEVMGGNGILVPPRDSDALAEAILNGLKLSEEEKYTNNISALNYVKENFDLNKIMDKWIKIYHGKF